MLREVFDSDLPTFFEHQRDPVARTMAAFVCKDPYDRTAFEAHWQRLRASTDILVRTILVEDRVAGHIASFDRDRDREITYWLGREHWGRDIATRALRAFLVLDPTRPLFGRVVEDAIASRRVLEKCDFVVQGAARGFAHGRGAEVSELLLRLD